MIHTTPARLRRVLRHLSSCHKSSCAVSAPASEWSKSLWSLSCQSFSSNSNRLPLSPVLFSPLFLRLVLSPSFSFLLFWESCQVPLFNSRAESSPRCRGNTPMAHRHTFFLLFLFFFLLLLVMLIFSFPLCPTVPETLEMFKVI